MSNDKPIPPQPKPETPKHPDERVYTVPDMPKIPPPPPPKKK